jgi:hypothetical protein
MRAFIVLSLLIAVLLIFFPEFSWGQCPMCKISAESNLKNGGEAARGLNSGILYMLAAPYLIMGVIGYAYWRGKSSIKSSQINQSKSDNDYFFN